MPRFLYLSHTKLSEQFSGSQLRNGGVSLARLQEMKAVASWPLHLAVATTIPARHTAFDLASQADVAVGACVTSPVATSKPPGFTARPGGLLGGGLRECS